MLGKRQSHLHDSRLKVLAERAVNSSGLISGVFRRVSGGRGRVPVGAEYSSGLIRVIGVVFLMVAERLRARRVSALRALESCVVGSGCVVLVD